MRQVLPILAVLAGLVALWYAAAVPMNITGSITEARKAGTEVNAPETIGDLAEASKFALTLRNPHVWGYSYDQKRPRLPAPHQIGAELYDTVIDKKITSKRSLVFHGGVTLRSTFF
ncbi:MAG: ABC transporter permease, partial [Pseudomonadota bacterium]